jgi:hypothetical protein
MRVASGSARLTARATDVPMSPSPTTAIVT